MYWSRELAIPNFTIPIFSNWLLKFIWEYYTTRWFFNNFWTNLATWFTQILPKQNTDFVHFIYWTNILNWPLNLALLHGKKKHCHSKVLTEPIDLMRWWALQMQACNNQAPMTALWSNGVQASSDWQRSDPMMLGIQLGGSHISGWPCNSLSQPCYNIVPVGALIGTPSAGGVLGHRLARLCLETVLQGMVRH